MGYNLNFDEIRNLQASLMSSVCGWQDLYGQIGTELAGFTGTMGYTGAGGTAIQNYIRETHGVVCQCLTLLLAEYTGRLLLFGEGLYEYDSDKHACLNEDALVAVGERLEHVAEDLVGLHETARREMQKITDQVDTTCHSGVEEYVTALYNKRTELREYRERIGEYDHTSAAGLEEMKELVSTLRGLADRLYEGGEIRAEAWEPGSFLTGEELEHLAGLVMNSGRFLAENGEAVSAAYEHYTQVWEEIIEELSEERVKQGVLLVLASALAIAGVILSAGTLAPEITATLGIAVAAYNSSNLLEGAQDIYYGLNGDPYTLAYNPMCETVFQGNREAYDLFGLTVNSAYAVVVPLNQFACATSTTGQVMVLVDVGAGAVTDYGVTRVCEAAGADDMTTFIMGFGAGMLTGIAVDSLNPSVPRRPGSMEMDSGDFHTSIRELQRRGYLGDGTAASSSFADMMSPEDSARYTHFLEYGSDSGLTPSELAGIQRLDDCLALGRVDYDEVLVLRRENGAGLRNSITENSLVEQLTAASVKEAIERNGVSVDEFSQLLDPKRSLTIEELELVINVRNDIGLPEVGTLMNKTIPQSDLYRYLNGGYNGVRGFVSVDEHSNSLIGLRNVYEGNRLDYNNTAFKLNPGVDGISQSIGNPDSVYGKITYVFTEEDLVEIPNELANESNAPYTGRGFTGSERIVLPELIQKPRIFIDGDILGIYDGLTGELTQQFIYDSEYGWVPK